VFQEQAVFFKEKGSEARDEEKVTYFS